MTSIIGKSDLASLKMRGFGVSLCLLSLGCAQPVAASLGGSYATVASDRLHMKASIQSTVGLGYTAHVLRMANSTLVREFAGSDGVVFAVAWRGPGKPDLRQLLGPHFATLQANTPTRATLHRRVAPSVDTVDLQIRTGGHPGGFWGYAILSKLAPAGFTFPESQ